MGNGRVNAHYQPISKTFYVLYKVRNRVIFPLAAIQPFCKTYNICGFKPKKNFPDFSGKKVSSGNLNSGFGYMRILCGKTGKLCVLDVWQILRIFWGVTDLFRKQAHIAVRVLRLSGKDVLFGRWVKTGFEREEGSTKRVSPG